MFEGGPGDGTGDTLLLLFGVGLLRCRSSLLRCALACPFNAARVVNLCCNKAISINNKHREDTFVPILTTSNTRIASCYTILTNIQCDVQEMNHEYNTYRITLAKVTDKYWCIVLAVGPYTLGRCTDGCRGRSAAPSTTTTFFYRYLHL